jgi:putative peptidoglycan lipid II flippase
VSSAGPDTPIESVSLARSTAVMTAGTVASRVTGVVRLAAMAAALGIAETRLTDTYNLANTAPNILYELVLGGVVTSVFVPLFVELFEKEERDRAWRVVSGIVTVSLLALSIIAIVGVVAAPLIAKFYSGRLTGPDQQVQRDAITFLLRLFLPQIVLYGIYFIGAGILNAHKRFGPPMWTPIVNNIVLIAVFIAFHQAYGAVSLHDVTRTQLLVIGLGTTLSVAPMGVLLIPYLRKVGRFRFTLSLDHPAIKKLGRLAIFVVGFVVANQAGYIVIQWLANRQQGAYSAYISAFTFFLMPVGLFVWSITTALLPSLSQHATNERWTEFRSQVGIGIRATLFLMVPATLGYLALGHIMVRVLLQHGVATASSTELVTDVLRLFVLGLVQFSIFQLLIRAFYALQDTRTPFVVNCIVVAVNVALAIPLFVGYDVRGIAAAQAVANTVGMVVLAQRLTSRVGGLEWGTIGRSAVRIAIASVVMGAIVGLGVFAVDRVGAASFWFQASALVILSAMGAAAYLGMAKLVGVSELSYVTGLLRRRGRGPKPA